jgi:hypothetical protein
MVSGAALAAAERGVDDLPGDATFNDAESDAHYGLAWWACEYVARSYGAQALWSLLDQLNVPDATEAGREQVLEDSLGIGQHELARRAGRLMVVTFDPGALVPDESPGSPESRTPTESNEPSATATTPVATPSVSGTSGR